MNLFEKARSLVNNIQNKGVTNTIKRVLSTPVPSQRQIQTNAIKSLQTNLAPTYESVKSRVLEGTKPIISNAYNKIESMQRAPEAVKMQLSPMKDWIKPVQETYQKYTPPQVQSALGAISKTALYDPETKRPFPMSPYYDFENINKYPVGSPERQKAQIEANTNLMMGIADPMKTVKPKNFTPLAEKFTGKANDSQVFKGLIQNWRNNVLKGKQIADEVTQRFTGIPEEDGFKIVKYIENPTVENASKLKLDVNKYQGQIQQLKGFYESVREEGLARGLNIGYLDNYINHVWKETPQQIMELIESKAKGLGKVPSFVKERRIPTYEEGISAGLTPKFTHPSQLAAHYKMQLERVTAAQDLVKKLQNSGLIQAVDSAPMGWKPIDAPLVPDLNGRFAPKKIAEELNNVFGQQPENVFTKLVGMGSKISRAMQEVTLSGGIRTLNAFSLGNMVKEFTAGRFKGPIQAFIRSFADEPSKKYFIENSKVLEDMTGQGIPIKTNLDYTTMYRNMAESDSMKKAFGRFWNDNINKPTFSRFLPMLQVEFYKDALKNGMSKEQAVEATRKFYGIADNFTRPKWVEDTLSTIFFAPKFRESMINFWGNTAKSLNNIKDPTNRANQAFIAGTLISYTMYSALNKKLTGRYMHENKDGKEFSLEIPRGNGKSWYIPLLPSIGTLPRRALEMTSSLMGGDVAGATQKAGSFFSQPVSLGSQLLTNKTFYGGPIYKEEDPAYTKIGKLAGYGVSQSLHPLLGEPIEVLQGRKTPAEAGMGMLELPVYPSRSTDMAHLKGKSFSKYQALNEMNPQEAAKYSQEIKGNQHKEEVLDALYFAKRDKGREIAKKYGVELYPEDLTKGTAQKMVDLVAEGKRNEALKVQENMRNQFEIEIYPEDIQDIAKSKALELLFSGDKETARMLQSKFGFEVTEEDLYGKKN